MIGAAHLTAFWYIAAESGRLRRRPLGVTVLGRPMALFRDNAGQAFALEDRCAHRNAPLSAGRVARGCLECPYHGWRYDGSGRCTAVPSLPGNAPDLRVRAYPTVEQDGYVWVCPQPDPPPDPPRPFPHLGESGWTSFRMRTRFQAGAFECLENFLDCPHTVYVHQGWFRSREAREVRAVVRRTRDEVCVEFVEERDAGSLVSRTLFPKRGSLSHTDRFLMPTTSRVDYSFGPDRHFIITSHCRPTTEGETEVYTVISFRFRGWGPLVRLYFEPLSRRIIRQDVEIMRLQGEQVRRFGGAAYAVVRSDLMAPHIRHLWARAGGDAMREEDDLCEETVLRF